MGLRILMIGQNDPAGMMIAFANAINRYTEHTARVVSLRTVYSMDYEYDLEIPRLNEDFSELEHLLKTSDIFHFHMLMDENHQLGPFLIKDYIKGKKLLHHHHGTYDHQLFLATASEYNARWKKLNRRAIVSTPDLLKLLPVATWQPNLVPLFEADFLPREDHLANQEQVKIAQAPTRKWDKHTKEFLRVSRRLCEEFPFVQSQIIEGCSYRQCLKSKRSCHMVFDHMNGWFGISSLESLAQGVPVFAGLDEWNIRHICDWTGVDSLPWQVVKSEDELYYGMREMVLSPEKRVKVGSESRKFMETVWNENRVIEMLLKTYEEL